MKPKILVTREIFPETLAYLREHLDVEDNQSDNAFSPDVLAAKLQDKIGLMSSSSDKVDASLLQKVSHLKAVCNIGVGYNNIDVNAATQQKIMVTNTPGVLDDTVADTAFAFILATARRMTESEQYLREGKWVKNTLTMMLGRDVHHATLGIVGMGRIGQAVARRARGFDMNVIYYNRNRVSEDIEKACNAKYVSKQDLMRQADFIVLLVPYTPENHHLIGAAEIALMKSDGVLINIARGGIVDELALIDALKNRKIFGAGVDVFENEPNFRKEFLQLANVVLLPHLGSASENTRRAMANLAAKNLVAALTTGKPPNQVNKL
jgi:glyoxylate/hydroxypyruvate/2-ketogluconate reductase